MYEYGARWYDPAIGRFIGVDPIADQFAWVSVYNYAENEPVGNIDLHGLQKVPYNLKEYAAGLLNRMMGTNISTTGGHKHRPITHGRVDVKAEGNLKAGLGMGAKVSGFGVKGEVNADIGSYRVMEGSVGTDGTQGNIMDMDNYVYERDLSVSVSDVTENIVALGAGIEQTQTYKDGEAVSNQIEGQASATLGKATYEVSTSKDLQAENDVSTYSFSIGFGAQIILGGEAKLKIEFKTSTDKDNLE